MSIQEIRENPLSWNAQTVEQMLEAYDALAAQLEIAKEALRTIEGDLEVESVRHALLAARQALSKLEPQ